MTDDNIELSRRKILAGIGALGAAGAGAGLGTSAYFNDEETFEDNVVTAGSLDLIVEYASYWDQDTAGTGSVTGAANGEAVSAELTDVKPGDNGLVAFCPVIETNPAYLWLCGELTGNAENGQPEPEAVVDDSGGDPGAGAGELADAIEVEVSYCDLADEIGDSFDPSDVTASTSVWSGSLAELFGAVSGGIALDGEGTPAEAGGFPAPGEQACFPGTDDEAEAPCLCLDWELPADVGNEVQTDSVAFDLTFSAEQCRHNDGTHNPCCPCGADEVAVALPGGSTTCVPVWDGGESVQSFYDFGNGSPHASQNPDIQSEGTTNLLVYEDDAGERSLVVVHDVWSEVESDSTDGTVSGEFTDLGSGVAWQVRDDDTGNDTYTGVDATTETVDWTWSANLTDGGALGPLSAGFDVGVDLDLIDGIDTVQYLSPDGESTVIADDLASEDTVSTRLFECAAATGDE